MDQYFARMRSLMNNKELPARIRFLLQDTVELRENNWVPRKAFIDNGPKTINQIRQDAVKVCWWEATTSVWAQTLTSALLCGLQDLGVFIPAPMSQGMRMDFFLESPFIPNRVKLDRETLGGLADMFGQMPGLRERRRFSPALGFLWQTSVLLLLRQWDRNRPGGHSGQVLAHDGPPSHQPALQWPRRPHCSSPAVAVRHGAKVLRQVQPGRCGAPGRSSAVPHLCLCDRCRTSISRTRTTWPSSKSSPRICLRVSARKARSTPTR